MSLEKGDFELAECLLKGGLKLIVEMLEDGVL